MPIKNQIKMAAVDRFSRPGQIAKFDPMTAQEIMAVPLMKQQIEDNQIAEKRDILTKLWETKAVGPDADAINQEKETMANELEVMANDISTKGISRQRTDQFNKLKTKYDKAVSLSGRIGHANEFASKRDQAKTNFYTWATKNDWPKDKMDLAWKHHSDKTSAFDEDGTFASEYQELGLPAYTTPAEVMALDGKDIGTITQVDANGKTYITNYENLLAKRNGILERYSTPGTDEYRMAEHLGWKQDYIIDQIDAQLASMISITDKDAPIDKVSQTKIDKARAAAAAQLEMSEENVWYPQDNNLADVVVPTSTRARENQSRKVGKEIEELRAENTAESNREAQQLEQSEMNARKVYAGVINYQDSTIQGQEMQQAISDAADSTSNPEFFRQQRGMTYMYEDEEVDDLRLEVDEGGPNWVNFGTKTVTSRTAVRVKPKSGPIPTKAEYEMMDKLYSNQDDQYNATLKDGIAQREETIYKIGESRYDKKGQTQDMIEKYNGTVKDIVLDEESPIKITSLNVFEGGVTQPMKQFIKDPIVVEKELKAYMGNDPSAEKSFKLKHIKVETGNGPTWVTTFTIPILANDAEAAFKASYPNLHKHAGQVIQVGTSVIDAQGSKARQVLSQGLVDIGTKDSKALADEINNRYKYDGFTPSMEPKNEDADFYNSDDLHGYFDKPGGQDSAGERIFDKNDKIDLHQRESGLYGLRMKGADNIIRTLNNADVFKTIDISTPDKFLASASTDMRALLVEKARTIPGYIEGDGPTKGSILRKLIADLQIDNSPFETKSHYKMMNLLSSQTPI